MAAKRPKAPAELGACGRKLWKLVVDDLPPNIEYENRELALLREAGALADDLALLEAAVAEHGVVATGSTGQVKVSPFVTEARQTRLAMARILAGLKIVEPKDPRAQRYGQAGAEARWHKPRAQA